MDNNYFEVGCECGHRFCKGIIYAQPDVDKERNRVIMVGVDDYDKADAYIWLSSTKAKEFANKLIELADKIDSDIQLAKEKLEGLA